MCSYGELCMEVCTVGEWYVNGERRKTERVSVCNQWPNFSMIFWVCQNCTPVRLDDVIMLWHHIHVLNVWFQYFEKPMAANGIDWLWLTEAPEYPEMYKNMIRMTCSWRQVFSTKWYLNGALITSLCFGYLQIHIVRVWSVDFCSADVNICLM